MLFGSCLIFLQIICLMVFIERCVMQISNRHTDSPFDQAEDFVHDKTETQLTPKSATGIYSHDVGRGSNSNVSFAISRDLKETNVSKISPSVHWNKSMSPEEFHWAFCPFRCLKGNLITIHSNEKCPSIACYRCSCQRPSCEFYKLCCPQLCENETLPPGFRYEINIIENSTETTMSLLSDRRDEVPNLSCRTIYESPYDPSQYFLTIRSCPKSFTSSPDVVRQCVKDVPVEEVTVRNYFWAEDKATGVVYHNMFCAICNGAIQAEMHAVNVHCDDYMSVYKLTSEDEMLRSALSLKSHCLPEKYQPRVKLYPCSPGLIRAKKKVSECSIDHSHDTDIVKACEDLTGYIYITTSADKKTVYKNMFCALCNTGMSLIDTANGVCRDRGGDVSKEIITYAYDPKRTAIAELPETLTLFDSLSWPLKCAPGKLLNTNCSSAFNFVRGLSYVLRLWLCPLKERSQNETLKLDNVLSMVEKLLQPFVNDYIIHATQLQHTEKTLREKPMEIYWLETKFDGITNISRDSLESKLVQNFIQQELAVNGVLLQPLLVKQGYTKDDLCVLQNYGSEINVKCINEGRGRYYQASPEFITVSNTLVCSFVTFSKEDYMISTNLSSLPPNITIVLNLNGTVLYFWEFPELNMMEVQDDGSLNVCHELLKMKTKDIKRTMRVSRYSTEYIHSDVVWLSQYVLTMVCLSLSVLCLMFTLIIYSWLPSLRTTTGINNMGLSVSLLLAQVFTISAYHRSDVQSLCISLGVLSHFMWLWMFTWTFIGSFHIYQVFTGRAARVAGGGQVKATLKKTGLSLLLSLLVVVTVVLTSYFTSGHVGYGIGVCHLKSAFYIGISIVLPLSVISACNLTLFLHIQRIRQLQTFSAIRDQDSNFLNVYVRLSSVTGSLWIVNIIGEAIDSDVLRYISIVLNGLQGVFLFISFICNKRVVTMMSLPVPERESNGASTGMHSGSQKLSSII